MFIYLSTHFCSVSLQKVSGHGSPQLLFCCCFLFTVPFGFSGICSAIHLMKFVKHLNQCFSWRVSCVCYILQAYFPNCSVKSAKHFLRSYVLRMQTMMALPRLSYFIYYLLLSPAPPDCVLCVLHFPSLLPLL